MELTYPEDLHGFRPRITAVQQVQTVNVRGYDSNSKRVVVGTESAPMQITEAGITRGQVRDKFPGAVIEIGGQSFSSQGEAVAMAKATLNQLANAYLAAEGECDGNPLIKAGTRLKIKGVGQKYSGTYRVAKAVHSLTAGGYVTQFSNSAGEHTLLGQAGGANGGPRKVDSIIVGVVTNNNDPDKMGRVKISLPSVNEVETFWAPVLLPAAGNERGISMLPRVDEQVIVAFENGDPSYPVVLGSMFNGRDKPGSEMAVTDGSFALKSDDNVLVAAKKDINLRSDTGKWDIKIDGGEIKEKVAKGYTGDFGAAWNLKATGGITVESSQSVTVKAPSITVEATGVAGPQGRDDRHQGSGRGDNLWRDHQHRIGSEIDDGTSRLGALASPSRSTGAAASPSPRARRMWTRPSRSFSAPPPASGRCGRSSAAASTTSCSTRSTPRRRAALRRRCGARSTAGSPASRSRTSTSTSRA